ncbi:MAG TPA: hypothetical protein VFE16_03760 [Candidatus Cybelea sp.]|jgi:hypothetical protein|nr:hypothetical protein [Candidatus Cybelea sp.]
MRPDTKALCVALVSLFLAGCGARNLAPALYAAASSAGTSADAPVSVVPPWIHPFMLRTEPSQPFVYDDKKHKKKMVGLYAAQFDGPDLLGYVSPNKKDEKAICHVAASFVNGFSVDNLGDLVVPNGYPAAVSVYKGPHACKTLVGKFTDSYGQASDAVAADATTGTIVVGNIEESASKKVGNIAVCTLKGGCTRVLHSSHIGYYGGGVAYAKTTGDCWISSEDNPSFSKATLTFFKACKGSGQAATGWKNAFYGGLMRDHGGHLISVDWETPAIWVYDGCNPGCKVVGGPFPLNGDSFYGNLNSKGDELAIGDIAYGQVDVYSYKPTSVTYLYSFHKGLNQEYDVEAGAFAANVVKKK